MNIQLSILNDAFKMCLEVMSPKPIIPAAGFVLCSFSKKNAMFHAADQPAQLLIEHEGEFEDLTFMASPEMIKYCKMLAEQPVDMRVTKSHVILKHARGEAKFPYEGNEKDFLVFPSYEPVSDIFFDAQCLKESLFIGEKFLPKDDSRPQMSSVHFDLGETSQMYASNAYTIASAEFEYSGKDNSFDVTTHASKILKKILPDVGTVEVYENERFHIYKWENVTLASIKFTKEFPVDLCKKTITAKKGDTITLSSEELSNAVKRVTVSKSLLVKGVSLEKEGNALKVSHDQSYEGVVCQGDIPSSFVNSNFLLDVLSVMPGEIKIAKPAKGPGVFVMNDDATFYLSEMVKN